MRNSGSPTNRTRDLLAYIALLVLALIGSASAQAPLPADLSTARVTSSSRPEMRVQAGEIITHQLVLENTGPEPILVQISQADFRLDLDGSVVYEPTASLSASNASWVEVVSQVEVPAQGTRSVPVTIQVPADVEPGTYWSLIFAEPFDAMNVERQEGAGDVETTVTVSFRFGVTLITHVGQATERELLFRDPALTNDGVTGVDTISVTIDNSTRFLTPTDVWLELYDPQGNLVREVRGDTLRIYPESSRRHTFELGELDEGTYQAVIVADAGDDAVFGVRYDLDLSNQ